MTQVVQILMACLKSSALVITVTQPLFMQHPSKGFVSRLEKGKLVLREQRHYYCYQVQGQMLSVL